MKTADLIDVHAADLSLVHLPWRRFGQVASCAGPVQTVKCFEDNSQVRAQLETPGHGRVLMVDGGGSMRVALCGDMLANLAVKNGWAGLVIDGVIRDSVDIDAMEIAVFALGTSPVKSAKEYGVVGEPISIGGVRISPGDWVYCDADGVLHSVRKLM